MEGLLGLGLGLAGIANGLEDGAGAEEVESDGDWVDVVLVIAGAVFCRKGLDVGKALLFLLCV